jgi:hypothetical protein
MDWAAAQAAALFLVQHGPSAEWADGGRRAVDDGGRRTVGGGRWTEDGGWWAVERAMTSLSF